MKNLILLCSFITALLSAEKGLSHQGMRMLTVSPRDTAQFSRFFSKGEKVYVSVNGKDVLIAPINQNLDQYRRGARDHFNSQLPAYTKPALDTIGQAGLTTGMLMYYVESGYVKLLPVEGIMIKVAGIRDDGTLFWFTRLGDKDEYLSYILLSDINPKFPGIMIFLIAFGHGCGNYGMTVSVQTAQTVPAPPPAPAPATCCPDRHDTVIVIVQGGVDVNVNHNEAPQMVQGSGWYVPNSFSRGGSSCFRYPSQQRCYPPRNPRTPPGHDGPGNPTNPVTDGPGNPTNPPVGPRHFNAGN